MNTRQASFPLRDPARRLVGYRPGMPLIGADVLRLVALGGVAVATVTDGVVGLALMMLVLGGCMVPRAWVLPAWFDVLFCTATIAAGWAALLDLYERIDWLDLVVHGLVTGLVGALAALVVHRLPVLSGQLSPGARALALGAVAVTTAVALAGLWEVGEWLGHTFLDSRIQVGYTDTVTDLLAGCVGAAAAAALVAVAHRREEW